MDPRQTAIDQLTRVSFWDPDTIRKLETLSEQEGDGVYRSLLFSLTNTLLSPAKARTYWHGILEHRRQLSDSLQREVDLGVAISDYLKLHHDPDYCPCLVDSRIYEQVRQESLHDKLTGLNNRAYFDQVFSQQLSYAKRYDTELSLLFCDIDNFKEINDQYGHQAGDQILQELAAIICREKRDSDIAIRYGGEEFILLMPHTGSLDGFILAERLRRAVAAARIVHREQPISVTLSGGLASFPADGKTGAAILKHADQALYQAKGAGKNVISLFKKDQRRYLRVSFNNPVYVKELDIQPTLTHVGEGRDICVGGILFENKEPLEVGQAIQVHTEVKDRKQLLLIGKIVRVDPFHENHYNIGVELSFNEMEKTAKREITDLLRTAVQQSAEVPAQPA